MYIYIYLPYLQYTSPLTGANHEGMMGLINIPRSMYNHVPKIGCIKKENNTILGLTHTYIYIYIYIHIYTYIYIYLVGGFNPSEKY